MRESIGSIALYNIIIIFIAVTFAILAGTMSYSKAFKANSRIINAIEKFEGYNEDSANEIDLFLSSIGYKYDTTDTCLNKDGVVAIQKDPDSDIGDLNPNYNFCVYRFPETTKKWDGRYVTYGVKTFINIDLPIVGEFVKIPVYGRSKMIFSFNDEYAPSETNTSLTVSLNNENVGKHIDNEDNLLTFCQGEYVENIKEYFNVYVNYNKSDGSKNSYIEDNYDLLDFSTLNMNKDKRPFYMRFSFNGMEVSFPYKVIDMNSQKCYEIKNGG